MQRDLEFFNNKKLISLHVMIRLKDTKYRCIQINHKTNTQKRRGMSLYAPRVLAPRTNYNQVNKVFYFERLRKKLRGVRYQQYISVISVISV